MQVVVGIFPSINYWEKGPHLEHLQNLWVTQPKFLLTRAAFNSEITQNNPPNLKPSE